MSWFTLTRRSFERVPAFFLSLSSLFLFFSLLQNRKRERERRRIKKEKFLIIFVHSIIILSLSKSSLSPFLVAVSCLVLSVYRFPYLPSPGFPSVPVSVPSQTLFPAKELFALSCFTSQLLPGFLTSLNSLRTVTGVLIFSFVPPVRSPLF